MNNCDTKKIVQATRYNSSNKTFTPILKHKSTLQNNGGDW